MNKPDFVFEEELWRKDFPNVIGVDEVGRGSIAGPVVAGAAILKSKFQNPNDKLNLKSKTQNILKLGIDDSKRVKSTDRIRLVPFIEQYFYTAIGEASVSEINRFGIVKATQKAMRRSLKDFKNYFILVDGYPVKNLPGGMKRQLAIIKGDQKSISIAAASIVAKVYRDKLMEKLSMKFPVYRWEKNKGYGTRVHMEMIRKFGICDLHRNVFVDGII